MNQRHELGELIASVQAANGWSDRDLERRADKLELGASKSNFSRLKNQPLISVKGSLIKDLSALLSLSEKTIADAALASMGVHIERDHVSVEDAVRSEPNLSERDQRIALGLVDLLKREGGEGIEDDPTPLTRAGVSPAPEDDGLGSFEGRARGDLDHESVNDGAGDNVHELFTPPPPASETAAWETENRGRKTRKQQDDDAEASQDPEDDEE